MVYHVCKRCGYKTEIKCNLINHLKRKNKCPPLIDDIPINDLLGSLQSHVKEKKELSNDIIHQCEICSRTFSTRQGKHQHKRFCNKENGNMDILKDQVQHLIDEINMLKESPQQNIYITNNTTNNTFILNAFKDVDTSYLKDDTMMRLLSKVYFNQLFDSLKELVRLVYYNTKHPENHTVYIPNVRNKYIKVWNGKDWLFKNRDEILTLVRNRSIELMNDYFFENERKFSMMQKQHLRKWHDRYFDDNDKSFDKQTKSAVEETILSYQSLVKSTIDRFNLL